MIYVLQCQTKPSVDVSSLLLGNQLNILTIKAWRSLKDAQREAELETLRDRAFDPCFKSSNDSWTVKSLNLPTSRFAWSKYGTTGCPYNLAFPNDPLLTKGHPFTVTDLVDNEDQVRTFWKDNQKVGD